MNTQKISSIEIPPFDKANYTLWKNKMLLFIRMANHLYIGILKNGPFTPVVRVEETTDGDMVISAHYAPKDPSESTEPEREKVSLDSALQLILIESLDNVMYNNIVNCDTAKQIWEKIEILCEGTEEVRSNQRRILISQYEGFMAKPKEGITDVFERFNKLINDLQLHDKFYDVEEVNLKFLLTLPDHLEQKISAIREGRDLSRITPEVLYGVLKTYELEMIQKKSLRVGQGYVLDGSSALIVNDGQTSNDEQRSPTPAIFTSEKRINDTEEQVILELDEKDEFYTLDELDELDKSMAYLARKFSNIRVKKPRFFKSKRQFLNKDSSWKGKGKKPEKAKKDKAYLELEAKYDSLLKKQQGKAYIAEGKSWDDSDNDEDEEVGNYAFMALEQGDSSSSKSQVPTLTTIDLNVSQYKETVEKMSTEMFHIHTSMVAANEENKPCANIAIGLDYEGLNNKKKPVSDKGKSTETEDVPIILKKVESPLFKSSISVETPKANQETKESVKEIKAEQVKKKKKNRNGKIGINKSNNFAYVADAPRKRCENCGSMNHLTHLCKKTVSNPPEGVCKYKEAKANNPYSFCDKFDCIPCNMKVMKSCHKLRIDLIESKIGSVSERENAQQSMNSILSQNYHSTSAKSVNKKKGKGKKVIWIIDSGCSRHMTGYGKIVSGNIVIEDVALVARLEVNLLSVSQFADIGFQVVFNKEDCAFISKKTGEIALKGVRKGSLFVADLDSTNKEGVCCFYTKASKEQSKLWHKKLSHLNFKAINTLVKKELVRDMPSLEFTQLEVCEACQKGKMKRSSHKSKSVNSISAPLQLIHMDFFGPVNVLSISRNKYALVMVDDFSRYTWVEFMYSKDETPNIIIEHIKKIEKQAEGNVSVKILRSDNGTEFRNSTLSEFFKSKGIVQEYSAARTPQ
ncbi:hypothetical protein AgCh_036862 [Apium graveolens]